MKTQAEIEQVLVAMDKADPDFEDEEMEAMRNAFGFVLGQQSIQEFISYYIGAD